MGFSFGGADDCRLEVDRYVNNGRLCVSVSSPSMGPMARLTTNLPHYLLGCRDDAFVDTNNVPDAPELIERLGIGEPLGAYGLSGRCRYPVYRFDMEKMREYE